MSEPERSRASDEELLASFRGDPGGAAGRAAVSELFGRYHKRVYLWCFRYVRDHDRALDLAQDALLNAWRSLDSFQERARFSSWLFAVARNRCLSAVRPASLTRDEDFDLENVPDAQADPVTGWEQREDESSLVELMRTVLAPLEQTALAMRCFERLPVDEITRVLAIPGASGARGVLQSARRKLRAALERRDAGEERSR